MTYTVDCIAKEIDGRVLGNGDLLITGVSPLEDVKENTIVFVKEKKNYGLLPGKRLTICVVLDFEPPLPWRFDHIVIKPENKEKAFIKLLTLFQEKLKLARGISERAYLHPGSSIGEGVSIGDFVFVGEDTKIHDGSTIGGHTYIANNCLIGKGCLIYPNVTIYPNTIIEDDVILHAGVVIGSDGFGYSSIDGFNRKIPQIGGVYIEKGVEIGANSTVDRATIGYTRIGENTKVDNLVQIAHNVEIGKNTIICGLCGISGSVKIGNNVVIAGEVGLKDHITIEDDVYIGAKSGVMERVVKKGSRLLGIPAIDFKTEMEFYSMIPKVKDMFLDLKKIKEILGI